MTATWSSGVGGSTDSCQLHNAATPQLPRNAQRPTPKTPNPIWAFWQLGVGRFLGVVELRRCVVLRATLDVRASRYAFFRRDAEESLRDISRHRSPPCSRSRRR